MVMQNGSWGLLVALAVTGCNAILGNEEGELVAATGGSGGATGGSGGATGGSGGATGGSGGATGGSGGATGGSGGATGGSGGATGGSGGATGGAGGATGGSGGTGGGNPNAAAADEVGVLFYRKSDASNSLRWIKSNHTQRTATAYSWGPDWTTITSAAKLAGAGAELILHSAGSPYVTTALSVGNDTATSQKTNANFPGSYELATKRSDGKVMMLNGTTGSWITGGWSTTWIKEYDGTITLPSSTTFEHFHRCGAPAAGLSSFIFYSTNDTLLYTRIFGTNFTTATQMAVPASSHATCVGANENFTFVYASSTGGAKLYSASTELTSWGASSFGAWTHIVNLRSGLTLFYRTATGEGVIGEFKNTAPYFSQLGAFAPGTFPTGMDIVTAL